MGEPEAEPGPGKRAIAEDRILVHMEGIGHNYGDFHVLDRVELEIVRGEIVSMVGPSGCGKSTLLRAIIGTHPPNRGQVVLDPYVPDQRRVVAGPGQDRGIVYQNYCLFPYLTARENVAVGPKLAETTTADRCLGYPSWRQRRARHLEEAGALLTRLGLERAIDMYPAQMSGGMRQRVAIAQALIMRPALLLLDEPFGALDEATREELQDMLLSLYQENLEARKKGEKPPHTMLIVTHELNEALYVGDRVVGLSQYWDWHAMGHPKCPGARIIYDKPVPVFAPWQPRDPEMFREKRAEIRQLVFDADTLQDPDLHCTFWDDLAAGKGEGILAP
jgi:NitT/TauT family transport system ATP-binding protein